MSEEQNAVNLNDIKENDEQNVTRSGKQRQNSTTNRQQTTNGNVSSVVENNGSSQESAKQENPFSFKHFLRDSAATTAAATTGLGSGNNNQCTNGSVSSPNSNNICHSRSTSIINGTESQTPSKSATTSSLNQNHNTGARPKIPQFQSVHALGGGVESKMKRSPRFPSFDSQSSLSELSDDRSNLLHSCSNSSFNSEHLVQRSFSNYDIESPTTNSPKYERKLNHTSSSQSANLRGFVTTNRVGAAEFPATLPDFVQDHIVMEQWYHGLGASPKSNSPVSVDFENLPDFTINNLDDNPGRGSRVLDADAFDLNHSHSRNRTPARNASPIVPLDLPTNRNNDHDYNRREQAPADLPPDITEGQRGAFGYGGGADINRDQSTDKIQTLPDFLSDGPIHSSSRLADVTQDTPHFNSPDESANAVMISRLQGENDLLRRELDDTRQIIINQTCRISELEHLLYEARQNSIANVDVAAAGSANADSGGAHDGSKRESSAAGTGSLTNKLKQQVKHLQSELEVLRRENESLKEEGAVGGAGQGNSRRRCSRTQQLSRELRLAASSAENNLRQLLTGVDNLRILAANLENVDRLPDSIDDYLSDEDDNDFAGPAL